jgi:DNA-binding transcriptional MerR regulator
VSGFPAAQATRLGGCTRSQLGHWRRSGIVAPSGPDGRYSFRDLVALRVVVSLLDAGLPMVRVRAALEVLHEVSGGSGADLAGLRIVTDGVSVFACYDDGQILDALRNGQLALFVAVDRFAADLDADVAAFTAERDAFLAQLRLGSDGDRDGDEPVVGRPVVAGVGVAR